MDQDERAKKLRAILKKHQADLDCYDEYMAAVQFVYREKVTAIHDLCRPLVEELSALEGVAAKPS